MCEFASWIEMPDGEIRFLTADMIYKTRRGKELQRHNPCQDDWVGHGAILFYFDMQKRVGIQKECTDFSTPENFPKQIVTAIKAGKMVGLGTPIALLSRQALAEYEKIDQPAFAEYKKIDQQAWAEYEKIEQQAFAEYENIDQQAWAEYEKIEQPAFAEYEKIDQPAFAEYEKIEQPAFAEYENIDQQALAEYEKIEQPAFAEY
jgi:vacuolar-type H+-ATPase subunit E/Vma4